MSLLDNISAELQRELVDFVRKESEDKNPKPLKYTLQAEILRQIIVGDREMTGMSTNQQTGDVFVRFSFTKDEKEIKE